MKEGDLAIHRMVQSNGISKTRPVLVLREMPPFNDFLVCGVSTQLHQAVLGFDEIVRTADVDYVSSGLKADSVIRLGFLPRFRASSLRELLALFQQNGMIN